MRKENTGAYIHIPFCKKKCKYCSFVSSVPEDSSGAYKDCVKPHKDYIKTYLNALLKEIECFYKNGESIDTLYFGGGTPSLAKTEDIKALIDSFKLAPDTEITVEVNPESADCLDKLYNIGVNRLSIGVQSFNDSHLKGIGRLHSAQCAKDAVIRAKEAGFKNISIDLMYGLPEQSLKDWENTLDEALKLNIEHISLYGLKIEEGCYFYKNPPKHLPDSDTQADMYILALEKLKGYDHYEISNFAKSKEYRSKHNLGYWSLTPYYGFGVGASGFLAGKRYTNTDYLENYIENPLREKEYECTNIFEEEIFLGFRKCDGIDIKLLKEKYGVDFEKKYAGILEKYPKHILKTEKGYKLSTEGILLSNVVLGDFL